ncbi:MAG: hypothetical protein ABIA74_04385 [bacterium]
MKNNILDILKKVTGIILIIFGIIGSFLPIIQGFLLIAIGIALLGNKWFIKKIKQLKNYLAEKYKK